MNRVSIRWLLLGVAIASLILPAAAVFFLRSFDAVLVRQTERELNAQGAVIAASVQAAWARNRGKAVGNPRALVHQKDSFTPLHSAVRDLSERAPPLPVLLPHRHGELGVAEKRFQAELSEVLRNAQVFNLSGVRVLDAEGCVLASSRAQLDLCFHALPEVQAALVGQRRAVLRERFSDEPAPALSSFSRRGDVRVFVALPIWNDGTVVGVVLLSRTAESGLEWLFKQRRDVFYSLLLMMLLAVGISLTFSRLITRPLGRMRDLLLAQEQQEVKLAQVSAPREIHTLGAALDERARLLEEKSRYVAEFAANVSHELKTPLTSIRGAVELLRDNDAEMSRLQRSRFLENIDAAAERTSRLVSRLLQLARLEARQGDGDEPRITVGSFLEHLRLRYAGSIEVQIDSGSHCVLSASCLESILINLIDNALRYRAHAPVLVSVKLERGLLVLGVVDDGPGISVENQGRLFERFFTTERDSGGTGLGLSIVQATAQNWGGHVTLQSDSKGTTVVVTVLPSRIDSLPKS